MACCRKKSVKEKYFSHRPRRGFGDVEVEHACQYLLFFSVLQRIAIFSLQQLVTELYDTTRQQYCD